MPRPHRARSVIGAVFAIGALACAALLIVAPASAATGPRMSPQAATRHAARGARPSVTGVAPRMGPLSPGTKITVTGHHFVRVSKVVFGKAKGTHVHVSSTTRLTVIAPAHSAATVDVHVVARVGTSAAAAKDHFTFAPIWSASQPATPTRAAAPQETFLVSVTCAAPGSCVAVGRYADRAGKGLAVIDVLAGGRWRVIKAPLPHNAAGNPGASLGAVACARPTSCVAVGQYTDTSGDAVGLIDTLTSDRWSARQAPLPSSSASPEVAGLTGLACPASGACTAIGTYLDSAGNQQGLIETLSGRAWMSRKAPLPGNAATEPDAALVSVSCPSATSCVTVGSYIYAKNSSTAFGSMIDTSSHGSWSTRTAAVPADAVAIPTVSLVSVSCAASGFCVAVGGYNTGQGNVGLIDTRTNGAWTGRRAPLTARISGNPQAGLQSVSCPSSIACVAVGSYLRGHNLGDNVELVDTLANGAWTARQVPIPAGAAAESYAGLGHVTCPTAGSCVAAGSYVDHGGVPQGVLAVLTGRTWAAVRAPVTGPARGTYLYSAACGKVDSCVAVGGHSSDGGINGLIDTLH